jgi:predicted nucleic acid-binding protein
VNKFLIDTNVLSEFAKRQGPSPKVKTWLQGIDAIHLYVSILNLAEIQRGIALLQVGVVREKLERWLHGELVPSFLPENVLPVTNAIANRWAVLSARAQEKGLRVPEIDGLIGATAAEHGLTVATRNLKDFSELGIQLFNPWEEE